MASRKLKPTQTLEFKFDPRTEHGDLVTRADLVFLGVDHSDLSYEVWVFLNNTEATHRTERSIESGYAGRYIIFGHGGCFGGEGHCEIADQGKGEFDLRRAHPLTRQKKLVHVGPALEAIAEQRKKLESVTLVPITRTDKNRFRASPDLLSYDKIKLQTYLS